MDGGVRVRFAPSPTGYLHIGGARTALFNWLYARHFGGEFVLRIEDTDALRTVPDSIEQILSGFRWLGMDWDEGPAVGGECGPYFQSQRRRLYRQAAEELLKSGHAYWCYCTPEELKARRDLAMKEGRAPMYDGACRNLTETQKQAFEDEGHRPALRLLTPDEGVTAFDDLIRGHIEFENALTGDFVLLKSDGFPTYNFACVVDDSAMNITHVIRADEHISNTPRQIMIYRVLGLKPPEFAHVPMILAPDRSKLSKRHGAMSVQEFHDLGYLPEAVLNYLAFLGWTPSMQKEVVSIEEMVRDFAIEAVSKNPAIYDLQKLTWMNGHYMRTADLDRITELAIPFMHRAGLLPQYVSREQREYLKAILSTMRDRVKTLVEIPDAVVYFYRDDFEYEEKGIKKQFAREGIAGLLGEAANRLSAMEGPFGQASVEQVYREIIEERGIPSGELIHPTRLALTGRSIGPGLFDVLALLGKERSIARLWRAVGVIQHGGAAPKATPDK